MKFDKASRLFEKCASGYDVSWYRGMFYLCDFFRTREEKHYLKARELLPLTDIIPSRKEDYVSVVVSQVRTIFKMREAIVASQGNNFH